MAITARFGLDTRQLNALNTFINSTLYEEVYVRYPPGYYQKGFVLRLRKAFYELRRSPLLWIRDLSKPAARSR